MISIKHRLLDLENDNNDLFIHLHLDTETIGYLSGWDRLYRGEFRIKKTWIGEVNTNNKQFRIRRTIQGILQTRFSLIVLEGEVINSDTRKTLKLRYGFSYYTIAGTLFVISLLVTGTFHFKEMWIWLIIASVCLIKVFLFFIDLNKTEEKFEEYMNLYGIG